MSSLDRIFLDESVEPFSWLRIRVVRWASNPFLPDQARISGKISQKDSLSVLPQTPNDLG